MNYGLVVPASEVLRVEAEEITLRRKKAGLIRRERPAVASDNGHATGKDPATSMAQPPTAERVAPTLRPANGGGRAAANDSTTTCAAHQPGADAESPPLHAVGLALSGGGIRSGSVCLGFLQALYRRGILRHVDYLSTVSGGGYAGAFFSSLLLDGRFPRINWQPDKARDRFKTLDILPDASGRQPQSLAPILFGGERLNDPLPFASRWFLGVLLLNLCIFSGLIAAAALLAIIYRVVDMQAPRLFVKEFGVVSDQARSFFLPMLALLFWLSSIGLAKYSRRIGRLRTPLFAIFCATMAMGACSYLTTKDLALPSAEKSMEEPSEWREKVNSWTDQTITLLLVALGGALLPYLNPKGLLRSGENPNNAIERWTFAIASRAFLYGVPLLLFAYFARENISGYSAQRQSEKGLHYLHLEKFNTFWERVWREHEGKRQPGQYIWNQVAGTLPEFAPHPGRATSFDDSPLSRIVDRYSYFKDRDESVQRNLLRTANAILPWTWSGVVDNYTARKQALQAQEQVTDALNAVLATPELTARFAPRLLSFQPVARHHDPARVQELLARADDIPAPSPSADTPAENAAEHQRRRQEWRNLNWDLLQAHYGPVVRSPDTVFASVVTDADQMYRLWICGWALGVFLVTGLLIDLNAISLHGYYRQKLGEIWINEMPNRGYRIPIRELSTTHKGGPYHLINGTLNLMRRGSSVNRSETARFTFSHRYCGSARTGYARTDFYDGGNVDLADAIGISAAAVNPASVRNPLVRALLLVLNFRLGQWVPNPNRRCMGTWWATPIRLFFNWIRHGDPEDRAYCFITDGGHDENTAIGALLERRCRVIIAVDSTQDASYQFVDFLKLVRMAAAKHGVRIVNLTDEKRALSFTELRPTDQACLAKEHFLVARIKYPPLPGAIPSGESRDGFLILAKPNLTNDEPTELLHYRTENPLFPHDPTLDQFYDPRRFACYRQLGDHMGEELCDTFFRQEQPGLWLAEKWLPPSELAIEVPRQFDEATCDKLMEALRSEDQRRRVIAITILNELGPQASKELRGRAVETLRDVFWEAHRKGDTCIQDDACRMIAHLGKEIPKSKTILRNLADKSFTPRTGGPIALEIRETASILLEVMKHRRHYAKKPAKEKVPDARSPGSGKIRQSPK